MPPGPSQLTTAINHPLRRRIILIYLDETLREASAAEVARATGEQLAKVAYHLKTLVGCKVLEAVERPAGRQGAGEALYAWALGGEGEWLRLVIDFWSQSGRAG